LRKASNKPIIAVICAGSAVDVSAIESYADAIVYAWYPGEQGGNAFADILFGKVSPSGKLPLTFYQSLNDVPDYSDYNMKGRTYRYFNGKVQYPFGYGLSYTSFDYSWNQQPGKINSLKDTITFLVNVKNTGEIDGDEVVQAYIQYPNLERMPLKELKSFKRISVTKGDQQTVQFRIPLQELQKWDLQNHQWKIYPGDYSILVGGSSQDVRLSSIIKIKQGL
jgi:beta-glucosidase